MVSPRRYFFFMLLFLAMVAIVAAALYQPLYTAFATNYGLNGLIVFVLIVGIAYIIYQVLSLNREVAFVEGIRTGHIGMSVQLEPRLLKPLASKMEKRKGRISFTALQLRAELDGISARLDERRDISRYLIGLLVFLGLLGTFWGLLGTISSVANVISGLSIDGAGDMSAVFSNLKEGLQQPLSGMGTAFSSSLFGLAGSLVLGFLELQAGQAQNRFYNELEDWLSEQARLTTSAITGGEAEHSVPAYVEALLERSAESLEELQRTLERGEEGRIAANSGLLQLTERLTTLTDQMKTEQSLMMKIADSQLELKPILAKLADNVGGQTDLKPVLNKLAETMEGQQQQKPPQPYFDDGIRTHVRNLDVHVSRLLEELASGRSETVQELRTEIRTLSRMIAALVDQTQR